MSKTGGSTGGAVGAALKAVEKSAKGKQRKLLQTVVGEYFAHLPEQDLEGLSGAEMAAIAAQQADAEQETPAALVSVDQAVSTPNVAVMDAGFLTPADIAQVFPDGASCTFAFTTQSPAALAVGETGEGRSALLKIGGSLVQLAAAEPAGQFAAPGMTASLEKLDDDWRADSRLTISLDQGLTAGYDGFSNCSG